MLSLSIVIDLKYLNFLCFILIVCHHHKTVHSEMQFIDDNVTLLIKSAEYPAEVHDVKTDDGYYVRLHRIPKGKFSNIIIPPNGINFFERIPRTNTCISNAWIIFFSVMLFNSGATEWSRIHFS